MFTFYINPAERNSEHLFKHHSFSHFTSFPMILMLLELLQNFKMSPNSLPLLTYKYDDKIKFLTDTQVSNVHFKSLTKVCPMRAWSAAVRDLGC